MGDPGLARRGLAPGGLQRLGHDLPLPPLPSVHSRSPSEVSDTRLRIAYPYDSPSVRMLRTRGVTDAATKSFPIRM
jgi:hypothetical protein